jgi:hypothetical protein
MHKGMSVVLVAVPARHRLAVGGLDHRARGLRAPRPQVLRPPLRHAGLVLALSRDPRQARYSEGMVENASLLHSRMASAPLLAVGVVSALGLWACRTPVRCAEGQHAVMEKRCPECPTIKDPPPGYCACNDVWGCRDRPEVAEAKANARREAARAQRELEERLAREREEARKRAEAGQQERAGVAIESCVPVGSPEPGPRCATPEEIEVTRAQRAKSRAAVAEFQSLCERARPCRKGERIVRFHCRSPAAAGESARRVVAEPSCRSIAAVTHDPERFGCDGAWELEPACLAAARPRPPCSAGRDECCQEGGTIVRPCDQVGRPGCNAPATCRGVDGYCVTCRCLPPDTLIATVRGPVPIRSLAKGAEVLTLDPSGMKIPAVALRVEQRSVLSPHEVIELVLADGRTLLASPGHPLADGRLLAAIRDGDELDGVRVSRVSRRPYGEQATWDLLVDGPTGIYFANEIPVRSTLGRPHPEERRE